jgi:hypothetical protein
MQLANSLNQLAAGDDAQRLRSALARLYARAIEVAEQEEEEQKEARSRAGKLTDQATGEKENMQDVSTA